MDDLSRRILDTIASPDYQAITAKALAKRLKIDEDGYADFRSAVKSLIKAGRLEIAKDKSLSKATQGPAKGNVVGTFQRSAKGFGFVRPAGGSKEKSDQIFIPPDAGRDASTRRRSPGADHPQAEGAGVQRRGADRPGPQPGLGCVRRHLLRARRRGDGPGRRHDPRTTQSTWAIRAPRGRSPATRSRSRWSATPRPTARARGSSPRSSGLAGSRGSIRWRSSARSAIPDVFDDATLEDARHVAKAFNEDDRGDRLDLTGTLTVTIDPATARDFDDAITLTRDEKGYWSLGVHIADVSHFVRPGSPLDRTARTRGTSVYLPDRVIPMLPEILSNSLASLQAGHVRYTLSALHGVQRRGRPHRPQVRPLGDQGRPPLHLRAGDDAC